MKPTPELIYEYRMNRERAEREARERREAACTAIPRLREIADQRRRLAFDTGLMIMRGEDSSELRNKVEQLDKEELNLLLSAGLPPDVPDAGISALVATERVGSLRAFFSETAPETNR